MAAAPARPDLAAYEQASRMGTAELVTALRELLGAKLVAYLGGVTETRTVHQWADGDRDVASPVVAERLCIVYSTARLITGRDSREVAQAWFQGLNPLLDDHSPARLLRDGELNDAGRAVLAAARTFAATG